MHGCDKDVSGGTVRYRLSSERLIVVVTPESGMQVTEVIDRGGASLLAAPAGPDLLAGGVTPGTAGMISYEVAGRSFEFEQTAAGLVRGADGIVTVSDLASKRWLEGLKPGATADSASITGTVDIGAEPALSRLFPGGTLLITHCLLDDQLITTMSLSVSTGIIVPAALGWRWPLRLQGPRPLWEITLPPARMALAGAQLPIHGRLRRVRGPLGSDDWRARYRLTEPFVCRLSGDDTTVAVSAPGFTHAALAAPVGRPEVSLRPMVGTVDDIKRWRFAVVTAGVPWTASTTLALR